MGESRQQHEEVSYDNYEPRDDNAHPVYQRAYHPSEPRIFCDGWYDKSIVVQMKDQFVCVKYKRLVRNVWSMAERSAFAPAKFKIEFAPDIQRENLAFE